MGVTPSDLSMRNRYIVFVVWGVIQGIVTYLALIFLGIPYKQLNNAAICVLAGSIASAIVFALLLKAPIWLHTVGFLIVGALLPYIVMIIWGLFTQQRLEIVFPPLDTLFVFLWTVCSLPFALFAAIVYLCIWLISRRNRSKTQFSTSVK